MISDNFKNLSIVSARIVTSFKIDNEKVKRIQILSPSDKEGDSIFGEVVSVGSCKHDIFTVIGKSKKTDEYLVYISVKPGTRKSGNNKPGVKALLRY